MTEGFLVNKIFGGTWNLKGKPSFAEERRKNMEGHTQKRECDDTKPPFQPPLVMNRFTEAAACFGEELETNLSTL